MDANQILTELKKPLAIADVDFRVQSISATGWATIISYKNARVDANRLDKTCGANWQNDFKMIDGKMYGGVGIKIGEEWLWRWDVGTESNQDPEKGQASDAFKRACFKWGIGRELYDYPFILVQLNADEFTVTEYNGKKSAKQTNKLRIKDWIWAAEFNEDGIPTKLTAKDGNGSVRFSFPRAGSQQSTPPQAPPAQGQQPAATGQAPATTGKPWLNVMKDKDMTPEYQNVMKGIVKGTVKSVDDVKKVYRLSKDVEQKIQEKINEKIPA
jgi:hypothetical protein